LLLLLFDEIARIQTINMNTTTQGIARAVLWAG